LNISPSSYAHIFAEAFKSANGDFFEVYKYFHTDYFGSIKEKLEKLEESLEDVNSKLPETNEITPEISKMLTSIQEVQERITQKLKEIENIQEKTINPTMINLENNPLLRKLGEFVKETMEQFIREFSYNSLGKKEEGLKQDYQPEYQIDDHSGLQFKIQHQTFEEIVSTLKNTWLDEEMIQKLSLRLKGLVEEKFTAIDHVYRMYFDKIMNNADSIESNLKGVNAKLPQIIDITEKIQPIPENIKYQVKDALEKIDIFYKGFREAEKNYINTIQKNIENIDNQLPIAIKKINTIIETSLNKEFFDKLSSQFEKFSEDLEKKIDPSRYNEKADAIRQTLTENLPQIKGFLQNIEAIQLKKEISDIINISIETLEKMNHLLNENFVHRAVYEKYYELIGILNVNSEGLRPFNLENRYSGDVRYDMKIHTFPFRGQNYGLLFHHNQDKFCLDESFKHFFNESTVKRDLPALISGDFLPVNDNPEMLYPSKGEFYLILRGETSMYQ
jgi:hypothetical protein